MMIFFTGNFLLPVSLTLRTFGHETSKDSYLISYSVNVPSLFLRGFYVHFIASSEEKVIVE